MKYSICKYKTIKDISSDFSINAELFTPDIVALRNDLKNKNFKPLSEYAKYIKRGVQPEYSNDGKIKILRSVNIREAGFSADRQEFINEEFYNKKTGGQAIKNDVLLNSTGIGTLGRSCFVYNDEKYFIDGHITRIASLSELKPEFLYIYLNSKYGQIQIEKLYKGSSGQIEIYPEQIQSILIKPLKIQDLIEKIVQKSFENGNLAEKLYLDAQKILLQELNLINWQPKRKFYSIKNYSRTVKANRIDAEYFQSQYDEIMEKINKHQNGWDAIGNQFEQNKKNFLIDANSEYKYVEIGSINIANGEIAPENVLGKNLPTNAKISLQQDDILISKVRTYRGAVAIVKNTDYVGSGAFTVLHKKINSKINKETLYTYFKLKPILDLTLKYNTGSSYPTLTDEDILNMPIPIFQTEIQNAVKNNIQQVQKIKSESKRLLEIAKNGVEKAIEENEETAIIWINEQLSKIKIEL